VKEHEISLGRSSARRLRYMHNGLDAHPPELHDPPLMSVAQTTRRAGPLVAALRIFAQALDVLVRAEVRNQDRGTRGRIGLARLVRIAERLALTSISLP
jgi:hypothetical protein